MLHGRNERGDVLHVGLGNAASRERVVDRQPVRGKLPSSVQVLFTYLLVLRKRVGVALLSWRTLAWVL